MIIDHAHGDALASELAEIDDDRSHVLELLATRGVNHAARFDEHEIDPRLVVRTAADEKTGVGMGHDERVGLERSLGRIQQVFVPADPVRSDVAARLPRSPRRDGIALDRLMLPRRSRRRPTVERSRFESEIERFTPSVHGHDAGAITRRRCGRRRRGLRLAEVDQAQTAKLDLRRSGPGVELERESTGDVELAGVLVGQVTRELTVHERLDANSDGADSVRVPFPPTHEVPVVARLSKRLARTATIGRDANTSASLRNESAAVLVVDSAQPNRPVVDIRLVTRRTAVCRLSTAKLNTRVGARVPGHAKLETEVEVVKLTRPKEEEIAPQRLAGGDLSDDRALLDPPVGVVVFPPLEGSTVENLLRSRRVLGAEAERRRP